MRLLTLCRFLTLLLCCSPAWVQATQDIYGLGNGGDGALSVPAAGTVTINTARVVVGALPAGTTEVTVADPTGFDNTPPPLVCGGGGAPCPPPDTLLLFIENTGLSTGTTSSTSDPALPVFVTSTSIGKYELVRLSAIDYGTKTITLSQPLSNSYGAATQMIRVQEYTSVTIGAGGILQPPAWDGSTGGVLAMLVQGALSNDGSISASAKGFRGGLVTNAYDGYTGSSLTFPRIGCSEYDLPVGEPNIYNYGMKGEGLGIGVFSSSFRARGYFFNAGGGGECNGSGGGGGGNVGRGGRGGNTHGGDRGGARVGGIGGASIRETASLTNFDKRMLMGGGGGAANEYDSSGLRAGTGGGVVFIRGSTMTGSGSILAKGETAFNGTTSGASGGGGGAGAGGTVYARFTGAVSCAAVSASGGDGGIAFCDLFNSHGVGGGGGGGLVVLQAASVDGGCQVTAAGGAGALCQGLLYGNENGETGSSTTLLGGLGVPVTPTITSPANGAVDVDRRPTINGTATPYSNVYLVLDGSPLGTAVTDSGGNFQILVGTDLAAGVHTLSATSDYQGLTAPGSAAISFSVPPSPVVNTPVIALPLDGTTTRINTSVFSGTAQNGMTVIVFEGTVVLCTALTDGTGHWSCTTSALGDGLHTIQAVAQVATYPCLVYPSCFFVGGGVLPGPQDRSLPTAPVRVLVDTTAPAVPVISTPTQNAVISTTEPDFSGTADAGTSIAVKEGTTVLCTTQAVSTGFWLCTATPLSLGAHSVVATSTDGAGNVATSVVRNFVVDDSLPSGPVITLPSVGALLSTSAPTFTGTATVGTSVVVRDGTLLLCSTAVTAAGYWSCTAPVLAQGVHTISARTVAGSLESAPTERTFSIDSIAPAAPVLASPTDGQSFPSGAFTFSGTAEAGSRVAIILNGSTYVTVTADGAGNFAHVVAASNPLAQGNYQVTATAIDTAGNTSSASSAVAISVGEVVVPPPTGQGGGGCKCSTLGSGWPGLFLLGLWRRRRA